MDNVRIYNLDLNHNGQNYASFSGYVLSKKAVTNEQLKSITKFLSTEHQALDIKSFDREGEYIEDYCSEFDFFDLSCLNDGCAVILDLNVIEEGDLDTDLTEVFLSDNDGNMMIFKTNGETSFKII